MSNAIRWSQAALDEHLARKAARVEPKPVAAPPAPAKRSKYSSEKVEQSGVKFDSKKEARRWAELELMQAAGQISDLQRQVPFVLAPAVKLMGEKRTKPAIRYWADMTFIQDGKLIVVDVKSAPTRKLPAYRMKRHLLKTVHGLDIHED